MSSDDLSLVLDERRKEPREDGEAFMKQPERDESEMKLKMF